VRKAAVDALFGTLKKYEHILAASLAAEVRRDVKFAKARRYEHTMNAYLDIDNIRPGVVENLISVVHKNLKYLHRYVALRKRIMRLKDIHIYDLYSPLVKEVNMNIPYEKAVAMVSEALLPLGDEYVSVLSRAMQPGSGWNDVYPNRGKESGAFSNSVWGVHPFNKLNYMNTLDDVFTLAHEMGHAMHSYLNAKAQPYFLSGYSTFTAEIASTFNETLLMHYLLEKYSHNRRLMTYLLGRQIENLRTTIYRQVLFAEFEKKIHELAEQGEPLTADLFNKIYESLIKKYYGRGFSVGENDGVEWAYIPHFYYKYYVYTYATGLSSGISLAHSVLSEGKPARERYLNMLREPNTMPPLLALKKAGVDLTKPDAVDAACKLMGQSIERIEQLLKGTHSAKRDK